MIADFDDFVTWMYVIIDDLWQGMAHLYARSDPEPTSCSDSELLTMAIVSECRGWDRETHAISEWKQYRHLFPNQPERTRFNRRRRYLMRAINQIRQLVLLLLDVAQDAHRAIDSLPVPVILFHSLRNVYRIGMRMKQPLAIVPRKSRPSLDIVYTW